MKGEIYGVGCKEESTACLFCVSLFSLGLLGAASGEDCGGDGRELSSVFRVFGGSR